jgi:hypothetical protein
VVRRAESEAGQAGPPDHPGGARRTSVDLGLAAALDGLAGEQAPVSVRSGSGDVTGTLTACGQDFVTIRADGAGGRVAYVSLDRVVWVELR